MKRCITIICLVSSLLVSICADAGGKPVVPFPSICRQTLHISRGDSPWNGLTEGYEQEQAAKHIKSASLNAETYSPLPSLSTFDKPDLLMGKNERRKEVVVNKRYFGDLRRGDATQLGMGREHIIGTFRDKAFKRLKPDKLVQFLIQSQIIETYRHLEAKLCMTREENLPSSYQAYFHGVHTYCTNSCQNDPFSFVVTIDKHNGSMLLTGGDIFDVR